MAVFSRPDASSPGNASVVTHLMYILCLSFAFAEVEVESSSVLKTEEGPPKDGAGTALAHSASAALTAGCSS